MLFFISLEHKDAEFNQKIYLMQRKTNTVYKKEREHPIQFNLQNCQEVNGNSHSTGNYFFPIRV